MKISKSYAVTITLLLLIGCSGFLMWHDNAEKDHPLRLHIIANSDDPYDQHVKLLLRDQVLAAIEPMFEGVGNKKEAMGVLEKSLPLLEKTCNDFLCGKADYQAKLELGQAEFPTKAYGDLVLAAGEYDALRIVLGEGEGKNWWCVLFPPLCLVDFATAKEVDASTDSSGGYSVPASGGGRIQIRLLINDLLR